MNWFVYALLNSQGQTHCGIAQSVETAVAEHNDGRYHTTRRRGPWRLIHVEGPYRNGEALRREVELKQNSQALLAASRALSEPAAESPSSLDQAVPVVPRPE